MNSLNSQISNEKIVNSLNLKNIQGSRNINIVGSRTGSGVGMSQRMKTLQSVKSIGMQKSLGMQESQGNEYSKIYIATSVTPVYSEVLNQQQSLNISGRNICGVCGGKFNTQGQMSSNTKRIVYSCPIHGYSMIKKGY